MVNCCYQMMFSLKNYFQNLNLFQPPPDSEEEENDQQRHFNIINTRVFLILLILILICFGLVIKFKFERTTITLNDPTEEEFDALPIDVDCPCSHISFTYGEFISLEPTLHEICESEFISDRWIQTIYSSFNSTYFNLRDFRRFGSAQFEALLGFCNISKSYLQQNIDLFQQTVYLSSKIRSKENFQREIQATFTEFKETASHSFESQFRFVRQIITGNALVSGLQTNFIITYGAPHADITPARYVRKDNTSCNCLFDRQCTSIAVIDNIFSAPTQYKSGNITIIPGIASGCLPVDSILASTLECFYNETCLNELLSFFPTKEKFSPLKINNKSRFHPKTIVQSIVDNLMIEDWNINIFYTKYFQECASLSCTYSTVKRQSWIFVLTQLTILLATLTMVLEIIVPIVVRFIMDKINKVQYPKVSWKMRWQNFKKWIKKFVIELNTFKYFPYNDRQLRYQRYATLIYIILIIISVSSLTLYNALRKTIHYRIITNPSESKYIELEQNYLDDLTCPCLSLSIPYSSFITIQPQYHRVCSNYLTTPQWIMYSHSESYKNLNILDYRLRASIQFQTLAMLCEHAKILMNQTLTDFLQTQTVSSQVMRRELFEKKMIELIRNWKDSTMNQFKRQMDIIRLTTSRNQLMNPLNMYFQYESNGSKVINEPRHYYECNCGYETCYESMNIYHDVNNTRIAFPAPNFNIGCYPIEALLASTLECFYIKSCMEGLYSYFPSSLNKSWTFPALDERLSPIDETIESIFDRLMVANWSENINFTSYYNVCAPNSCIIEYEGGYGLLTIITMVSGIFSGISLGLQLFISFGLRIIDKFFDGLSFTAFGHLIRQLFNWNDKKKVTNQLHILLVIIVLSVLYTHYAFRSQLVSIPTEKPELDKYLDLTKEHSDSLDCFCSQISIEYSSFLNVIPRFHPVCSRDIVKEVWGIIPFLVLDDYIKNFTAKYGFTGMAQLLAIDELCKISGRAMKESLNQLLASNLVNNHLMSESLLTQHIQTMMNDFKRRVPKILINTFALTRMAVISNKLMNTYGTSWIYDDPPSNIPIPTHTIHTVPVVEQGCDCGLTPKCIKDLFGINYGCYIIEAFSQSSLACLYDLKCVDKSNTIKPLNNAETPSRFPINTTYGSLVEELMLEELVVSTPSYNNYFSKCAPSLCTHSIEEGNFIEGIIVLISLYGGVVIICRLIAVILANLIQYRPVEVTPARD